MTFQEQQKDESSNEQLHILFLNLSSTHLSLWSNFRNCYWQWTWSQRCKRRTIMTSWNSQIHILPYNSQAKEVVEWHFTIWEGLIKSCEGKINWWPDYVHHAFFANQVTVWQATGFLPYYLLHGVDPVLPLDLFVATYIISGFASTMSTADLLTLCIRQLSKLPDDITKAADNLLQSWLQSKVTFEWCYQWRLAQWIPTWRICTCTEFKSWEGVG